LPHTAAQHESTKKGIIVYSGWTPNAYNFMIAAVKDDPSFLKFIYYLLTEILFIFPPLYQENLLKRNAKLFLSSRPEIFSLIKKNA